MKIYSAEKDLKEQLKNNRISFASQLNPNKTFLSTHESSQFILDKASKVTATNYGQPDLFYFDSVLVSVGLNKNDDYFDVSEVWVARHTPEDKQINYEHNEKDIIGHITACYAIDSTNAKLADDCCVDNLPEKFHIITAGVLYRRWEDKDLHSRMNDILEEIAQGKLFVSMECLFNDFDYILYDEATKASEIVNRNQETAFLTKYLRGFGGTGVYKSRKIGRLLKNIVFSGKGIVKKPANPESIIFNETNSLQIIAKTNLIENNGEMKTMATETKELEVKVAPGVEDLRDEIKSLKASLDEAKKDKEEAKAVAIKEAQVKAQTEFADLKLTVAKKEDEVKSLTAKLEKAESDNKAVTDKLAESEKQIKAAQDELDKIAAQKKTDKRIALLVEAGKTSEEATELEKKFVTVDDVAFEAMAEMMTDKEKKDMKKKMDDKKAQKKYASGDDDNESGANLTALAQAQLHKTIAGVVQDSDKDGDFLAQFQKVMASNLKLGRKLVKENSDN